MSFMRWFGVRKKVREESPLYRFSKTNLTNGSSFVINLEQNPYNKYLPFNYIQVTNNTDQHLILYLNGGQTVKTIPSGTIISLDDASIPAFRNAYILNNSGSDATGTIEVIVQKVKSERLILKEVLEK